jgi:orotate phosphoribosyltransferase
MAKQVDNLYAKPDVIAGVATGAIGIGILVAEALGLPFVYVRPEPKSHGRKNQIEGLLKKGQSVVVIEDLISTGKSSLNAVRALRDEGANVKGMLAIFNYGFPVAEKNFKEAHVDLHSLSNYDHLLQLAKDTHYIQEEEIETLLAWKEQPEQWKAD